MYKIISIFELQRTDFDGRKTGVIGFFSTHSKASVARANDHITHIVERSAIVLPDGRVYLLESPDSIDLDQKQAEKQKKLAEEALKKLTPAEQAALGLIK